MLQSLNFVMLMLNGSLGFAFIKVIQIFMCFFWSEQNPPEGDFHISLTFAFFLCLCSMVLMVVPFHVLARTNFLVNVIPFLMMGFHLGFHLAISFLILSEYATCIPHFIRFVRHALMFLICNALMWLLPIPFLFLPRRALQLFITKMMAFNSCSSMSSGKCKTLLLFTIFLLLSSYVFAADASSSGFSIPKFNATRMKYNSWYIEFCGWIAMKYPDLVDLIEGDWEEPDEPADSADLDCRSRHRAPGRR